MAEALSSVTGNLQGQLTGLANYGQSWLDKIVPPETRNKILAWINKFAAEKPMLASFLASHVALSGPALGLFVTMTCALAVFALIVALVLALLGTLVFIVFMAGAALIFLLPTLFVTTAVATFLWLWGVGCYYLLKYFNEKPIPGIHVPLKEGLEGEAGDYADRGVLEGYAGDVMGQIMGGSNEEKEGEGERKDAEKKAGENVGKGGAGGGGDKNEKSGGGGGGGGGGGKKQPLGEVSGNVKEKGGQGAKKVTGAANGAVENVPVAGGGLSSVTKGVTG